MSVDCWVYFPLVVVWEFVTETVHYRVLCAQEVNCKQCNIVGDPQFHGLNSSAHKEGDLAHPYRLM